MKAYILEKTVGTAAGDGTERVDRVEVLPGRTEKRDKLIAAGYHWINDPAQMEPDYGDAEQEPSVQDETEQEPSSGVSRGMPSVDTKTSRGGLGSGRRTGTQGKQKAQSSDSGDAE